MKISEEELSLFILENYENIEFIEKDGQTIYKKSVLQNEKGNIIQR